jgi:hypothetical protein
VQHTGWEEEHLTLLDGDPLCGTMVSNDIHPSQQHGNPVGCSELQRSSSLYRYHITVLFEVGGFKVLSMLLMWTMLTDNTGSLTQ